jgi:tRNA-dihydrouridine synthase B
LIETRPADRPLAVQLFGAVAEEMRDAAAYLESTGISAVDINMGCPVRKVCRIGGGSAMMTELEKTAQLVRGMVDAVKIPVTAKMRLGWDEENLTAPDLARALEDAGIGGHFCAWPDAGAGLRRHGQPGGHPRRRAGGQAYSRHRQRRRHHPARGQDDAGQTGCAGVSIGRGAFYDPWIFRHTRRFLETGEMPPIRISRSG